MQVHAAVVSEQSGTFAIASLGPLFSNRALTDASNVGHCHVGSLVEQGAS